MFPDEEEISKPSGERRGKRIFVRKHSPYSASDAEERQGVTCLSIAIISQTVWCFQEDVLKVLSQKWDGGQRYTLQQ